MYLEYLGKHVSPPLFPLFVIHGRKLDSEIFLLLLGLFGLYIYRIVYFGVDWWVFFTSFFFKHARIFPYLRV